MCSYIVMWASYHGYIKVVELYLEKEPKKYINQAISLASENNHLDIVKLLEDYHAKIQTDTDNLLAVYKSKGKNMTRQKEFIQAVHYNNLEKVLHMLEICPNEINPSYKNNWPIRWASIKGYTKVVKLLLEDPRVDPSADDNYAIYWASHSGHLEVVKLLEDHIKYGRNKKLYFKILWMI